jgi:hypothetical protein
VDLISDEDRQELGAVDFILDEDRNSWLLTSEAKESDEISLEKGIL